MLHHGGEHIHHGPHGYQRSDVRNVVGWRDLNRFHSRDSLFGHAAQDRHSFARQEATRFRPASAGYKACVEGIDVEGEIHGASALPRNFQRDLDKYKAINAVILGVSVDTVDSHKQFCTKDSLSFTLLADPDKKVVTQYGSLGNYGPMQIANRNTFLINPEGKIVKVWTKVNPTVHSEEVLAALNEMQKKG